MITSFTGLNAFLSMSHPCMVRYDGHFYSSLLHAFYAARFLEPGHRALFRKPGLSAFKARELSQLLNERRDFNKIKVDVVRELVRSKFTHTKSLAAQLIATGNERLIYGNVEHDNTWGDCQCRSLNGTRDDDDGARCWSPGQNLYGWILMECRDELRDPMLLPARPAHLPAPVAVQHFLSVGQRCA